jgi:hypothetical protein
MVSEARKRPTGNVPKAKRRRFSKRFPGKGWTARIQGWKGHLVVTDISPTGIALESSHPFPQDRRYQVVIEREGIATETQFYVVRCDEIREAIPSRRFRSAGLFVTTLERPDIPAVIPADRPSS